ncbi:hypothetical protein [Thermococcus zilligii]|uniref:hypothetical protein n=1 Tax=Thermococcus zilligii TaxID=54076 RepID=UPI00029B3D09|nr:hypothetical protein [Thermococcus zilligii]
MTVEGKFMGRFVGAMVLKLSGAGIARSAGHLTVPGNTAFWMIAENRRLRMEPGLSCKKYPDLRKGYDTAPIRKKG